MWKKEYVMFFACFIKMVRIVNVVFTEASLQPPELFRNNSIEGRAGAFSVITPTMLQAYDDNTPFHELTFHVIQPPSHGDLVLAGSGRDVILQKKSTFTPDNLLSGRLRYLHNRDAPLKGSLTMSFFITENINNCMKKHRLEKYL